MPDLALSTYAMHTAGHEWSLEAKNGAFRFELRSGDAWAGDGSSVERAEIASLKPITFGQTYTLRYRFKIEPGQPSTAKWLVLGQFHATEDAGDDGVSPPFEINMDGEHMQVAARWSEPAQTNWSNVSTQVLFDDPDPIRRGHWYNIKANLRFDPEGGGLLRLWRDGALLVSYEGPLGYNDQVGPYWKQGIYRKPAPETMVVTYDEFSLRKAD